MCEVNMLSVSFKSNSSNQEQLRKNSIGLTPNGQKVLNRTNGYAAIANTISNPSENKKYLDEISNNPILIPAMIFPAIGNLYAINQYKNGNITKEDATKIIAYNTMTNTASYSV